MIGSLEERQKIECIFEEPETGLTVEVYLQPSCDSAVLELLRVLSGRGMSMRLRAKDTIMFPFIKPNDYVFLCPLNSWKPRLGDIVIVVEPKSLRLFIRRVVQRTKDSYILKGDWTAESIGIVQRENILGRVAKVERGGKTVHLGFGLERMLIACLSREGLLGRLYRLFGKFLSVGLSPRYHSH